MCVFSTTQAFKRCLSSSHMTQHSLSFLSRWGREPDSTSNSSATLMNSQSNQPDCTALIICNLQLMLHTTETFWCANLSWYGVRAQRNTAKDLWIPASFKRPEIWDSQHAANFRTETALHRATDLMPIAIFHALGFKCSARHASPECCLKELSFVCDGAETKKLSF